MQPHDQTANTSQVNEREERSTLCPGARPRPDGPAASRDLEARYRDAAVGGCQPSPCKSPTAPPGPCASVRTRPTRGPRGSQSSEDTEQRKATLRRRVGAAGSSSGMPGRRPTLGGPAASRRAGGDDLADRPPAPDPVFRQAVGAGRCCSAMSATMSSPGVARARGIGTQGDEVRSIRLPLLPHLPRTVHFHKRREALPSATAIARLAGVSRP